MPELVVKDPPDVEGYVLVARHQIPIRRVALVGFLTAPIWIVVFLALSGALGGPSRISFHITFIGVVFALLDLSVVMPAVHEGVHGVVAAIFGARPRFGIGAGFAYTTFREPVRPAPYLAIGLAPLVVLSALGVFAMARWSFPPGQTLVFLVGNACGAFGDLWVALRVLTLPKESLVCDLADGFAQYVPES